MKLRSLLSKVKDGKKFKKTVNFEMASGPFAEMQPEDCEYGKLAGDERPLIRFVPSDPLPRDHINKAIYTSSGKKDSTFDVQLFDGSGETEDLVRWWYSIEKYFSLARVTDVTEKFDAIPGFLAKGGTVQELWERCKEKASKVEVATSRPNSYQALGTTSEAAFQQTVYRFFSHYIAEEACEDQRRYLQRSIHKLWQLQPRDLISQLEQLNNYRVPA